MQATWQPYVLRFKRPSGTSRGILTERKTWFLKLTEIGNPNPERTGIGECAPLPGLSIDDRPNFESRIADVCREIDNYLSDLKASLRDYPSIRFGLETALRDLENEGKRLLFPSPFVDSGRPIPINGLIWMGTPEFMRRQIKEKLASGFTCLKMKIGALDFETELNLLRDIRREYPPAEIELRVDANGAFDPDTAPEKLARLAELEIHSIEQPIPPGRPERMAEICENSPLPIALDEELIGISDEKEKHTLLATIRPQYIILKPTLVGGFAGAREWIAIAEKHNIGWWVTSALESNIGLNAIAQWTATLGDTMTHGLGTGQLYLNNIPSPLTIDSGKLYYKPQSEWDLSVLEVSS
ncbi:MAG: o-succinylbenzoate synthase [FCB group bacterium]|nr:o-succinylbenzoate synthase [FCB group bacterium]